MLEARLKVLGGKHVGKAIPLPPGRFLVGRERDCHLRPSSDLVSRHHCVFYVDDYAVRLRDLGSLNGTLVNGERLQGETTLAGGDKVKIGTLELELSLRETEQAAAAPAAPKDTAAGQVIGDTAMLSSAETAYELPQLPPAAEPATAMTAAAASGYPAPPPGYPYPQGYPMYPPPGYGPPGYPMPPGYGPPPGYPMPPGYGPPPGYSPPVQPASSQPGKVEAPPVKLPPPPERV